LTLEHPTDTSVHTIHTCLIGNRQLVTPLCEDLLRSKRVNKILCPMSTTVWSNYLRVLDLDFEFAVKEKLII